jgi:uncharacterized protein (DUF488 family)
MNNQIHTIGHSTRSIEEFLGMLASFGIKVLADVRKLPGSRKYPQFDKENLEVSLQNAGIKYLHMPDLGGRRKPNKDSKNTGWRSASFRGYADYMQTGPFQNAMEQLEGLGRRQPTAYMCSEAVWWRCHRSLMSDYLKARGWNVLHIMAVGKGQPHKYTPPARVDGNTVSYSSEISS